MTADKAAFREQAQIHRDSIADTHEAYSAFQGWVLSCLWCDFKARGKTKTAALGWMQEHYERFGITGVHR